MVSQACLGKCTSRILDTHKMVNLQLSKQDSHLPVALGLLSFKLEDSGLGKL